MFDGIRENRRIKKMRKKERRDERWAPYVEKREAAWSAADRGISRIVNDYRFYTALVLVMSVVGFFWVPMMEIVALVGSVAMRMHWNNLRGTNEAYNTPGFGFWRFLPIISFPLSLAGSIYFAVITVVGFFS